MKCPNCGIELVGEIAKKKCPKCHYNMLTRQVDAPSAHPAPKEEPAQTQAPFAPVAGADLQLLTRMADDLKTIKFWVSFWSILSICGGVLTLILLLS